MEWSEGMKIITFIENGRQRLGAIEGTTVIDLNRSTEELLKSRGIIRSKKVAEAFVPEDTKGFLEGGEESFTYAQSAIEYALSGQSHVQLTYDKKDVIVGAPITNPGKIICVGHNYRDHILEMGREIPSNPVIFAKFANTLIGPEEDIPFFPISNQLDYEAEFTFVIGKQAKNVSEEEALDYVAGYTITNDVTYRDIQRRTLQWLQGKTVDGTAPMGPYLITTDELTDASNLNVVLTVNGEERQRTNTNNLVFTVEKLVAFLSNLMVLEPGDIVLTGTPGGVGFAMEPQVFLKDGDVVKVEIDEIGFIENTVKTVI